MKKPSLLKTRYAENPFINGDSFSVPLKKKAEVIQTEGPAAVTVGDERIAIAQIRRITTVDSDPFVKLFVAELDRFFDLSPSALRIVTVLIKASENCASAMAIRYSSTSVRSLTRSCSTACPRQAARPITVSSRSLSPRLHRTERKHTPVLLQPRHLLQWRPGPFRHGNQAKKVSAQERLERQGQAALPRSAVSDG